MDDEEQLSPANGAGTGCRRVPSTPKRRAADPRRHLGAPRSGRLPRRHHGAARARVGVSRVTVYRSFGSKQAILQALTWDELARARIDRVDAAHTNPDVRGAIRDVLRENCRMFAALGTSLPLSLELARHDQDVAALVDATYHGRRHTSMEALARRISKAGVRARGWTTRQVADAMLVLTSYEAFDTLTARRGSSPDQAASTLYAMTSAFLEDDARQTRPTVHDYELPAADSCSGEVRARCRRWRGRGG